MKKLLQEAGREFLKAFGASLVILMPGVLAATNLDQAYALGVSALVASVAAGVKAVQVFVPSLTFVSLFPDNLVVVAAWVDAFVRAFVGTFLVTFLSFLNSPDYSAWKAVLVGALVGAAAAGFRALEGLLTKGEFPAPDAGVGPGEA